MESSSEMMGGVEGADVGPGFLDELPLDVIFGKVNLVRWETKVK